MELFKLIGEIAIRGADKAKQDIGEVGKSAQQTANTISKSNQSTQDSNKSAGSSFGNLKSKVAEYKAQGMTTSQAWSKATQDMKSSAEKAENGISSAFGKIGAAVGAVLSVNALKNFGMGCIQAAADANAASSQFSQVFGDLESQASASLSKIASEAGITENRMQGSFTKIAAFAKTTGMDTESALALSERAMIAVADSAAFYDRSLEETTESLQSFLKGNFENDAALGLSCTEVTRNAAANALYGKSFNELSESQKQLTLLQMVEDANKASGALGQAARESDTWTNMTGNLQQAWKDFQAVIGSNVLPLAVDAVKGMVGVIEDWTAKIPELIDWCKEHESTLTLIGIAAGTLTVAIGAFTIAQNAATIATTIATAATTAWGTVMAFVTSPITLVVLAIGALIAAGVALYKNWDTVKEKCSQFGAQIKDKFNDMKESVVNKVTELKDKASEKFDSIRSSISLAVSNAKSQAVEAFSSMKSSISTHASSALSTVTSKFNAIKDKISSVMETAKSTVTNAVQKLKDAFDFDWSLPKIKLPHVTISGKFSLNPPSAPKFSIEWYKKAMNNAMILSDPTIFGYANGKMLGAGEAGNEVVAGETHLMNLIGQVVENKTAGQNDKIIEILIAILHAITGGNEEMIRAILEDKKFCVGEREFGRLVRTYAR